MVPACVTLGLSGKDGNCRSTAVTMVVDSITLDDGNAVITANGIRPEGHACEEIRSGQLFRTTACFRLPLQFYENPKLERQGRRGTLLQCCSGELFAKVQPD